MGGILLRKKLIAVAGVVISISLITGSMYQLKATTIKEEKDKQEELHKKIESANQILSELETLKNDTTAYINALDDRMGEIVAYIVDLNGQIADKESEIEQINKDLATQEEDIGSQYQAMKLRIQFLYENGHTEYLDMILNSKSIGDMLNKAEYLSKITEYDRNMLNKMRETKTVIENTKARLETEQKNLTDLKSQAQTEQAEVGALLSAKEQVLQQTNQKISDTQSSVTSMESELAHSQQIEAELEEIERQMAAKMAEQQRLLEERKAQEAAEAAAAAQKAKQEEEARKASEAQAAKDAQEQKKNQETKPVEQPTKPAEQPTTPADDGGSSKPSNNNDSGNKNTDSENTGGTTGYRWPLNGYNYISSYFVHRINPVTGEAENHSGIDIPAPAGTPVHAIASGTVLWAYKSVSAGNWVGINHGNGIVSVYMHQSGFNCKEGDYVKAGDVIGYVGSTGQSTGNHLHLTIREDGVNVNPLNYVSN